MVKLKVPDKIDPMEHGLMNLVERLFGGTLYHCCYCRVQFFDRRPLDPNASRVASRPEDGAVNPEGDDTEPDEIHPGVSQDRVTSPRDQAKSGE